MITKFEAWLHLIIIAIRHKVKYLQFCGMFNNYDTILMLQGKNKKDHATFLVNTNSSGLTEPNLEKGLKRHKRMKRDSIRLYT